MERTYVPVPQAWRGLGMSAAVKAGGLVFVAGQVPTDEAGRTVGEGDFAVQAEQCFANIARILGEVGGGLADVVYVTTYLASAEDAPAFMTARAKAFPDPAPATATLLARPLSPQHLLEIQVIAAVGD